MKTCSLSDLCLCEMQSCWPPAHTGTVAECEVPLWELAPLTLRPGSSAGKRWGAHSSSVTSCLPSWSLSISGSCSRVTGQRSRRLADRLGLHLEECRCWKDYISWLDMDGLSILLDELEEVTGDREVWASLPRYMYRWKRMDGWMDGFPIWHTNGKLRKEELQR